jgi:hypothetical protein
MIVYQTDHFALDPSPRGARALALITEREFASVPPPPAAGALAPHAGQRRGSTFHWRLARVKAWLEAFRRGRDMEARWMLPPMRQE